METIETIRTAEHADAVLAVAAQDLTRSPRWLEPDGLPQDDDQRRALAAEQVMKAVDAYGVVGPYDPGGAHGWRIIEAAGWEGAQELIRILLGAGEPVAATIGAQVDAHARGEAVAVPAEVTSNGAAPDHAEHEVLAAELAELLDGTRAFLQDYLAADRAQLDVLALFAAATWGIGAFDVAPYLFVHSAEPESGKTRALELLELLAARPLLSAQATDAALRRSIAAESPPTLLYDEVDNTFRAKDEHTSGLVKILNGGYRRGAKALLVEGDGSNRAVKEFDSFCPKVLCGIDNGRMPDTTRSRCVPIAMKRRAPDEHLRDFDFEDAGEESAPLREGFARWAEDADAMAALRMLRKTEVPAALQDRTREICRPLVAVADLAGGDWPARARAALVELCAGRDIEESSLGIRLLADARAVFDSIEGDRISAVDLQIGLRRIEESPWATLDDGRAIAPQRFSELLRRYGIKSRSHRIGDDEFIKGFKREQFEDAWSRYLADPSTSEVTEVTQATTAAQGRNGEVTRQVTDASQASATDDGGGRRDPQVTPRVTFTGARSGADVTSVTRVTSDPVGADRRTGANRDAKHFDSNPFTRRGRR